MTADDAGSLKVALEAVSNSGGSEPLPAVAAVAEAADASKENSAPQALTIDDKSAHAWLGFCHGLTKADCLASPTATPISDPSLSEVSSSHGGLTPRGPAPTLQRSPVRWADEPEADDSPIRFRTSGLALTEDDDEGQDDDPSFSLENGDDPTTPSKRSRRSNRRRRARAEKAAAAQEGLLLGRPSPGASNKEMRDTPTAKMSPGGYSAGIRNSVTVGDLLCPSPQARSLGGRSPQASNAAGQDEVGWFVPVSPCQAQVGPKGIMGTSPCSGRGLNFGYDGSPAAYGGYNLGCHSPQACVNPYFAMPMNDCSNMWPVHSPTASRPGQHSIASTLSTSPQVGMEASSRTPPPLPVGPVGNSTTPLSSPCHARAAMASGIISTSPTSAGISAPATFGVAGSSSFLMGAEAHSYSQPAAGSPDADALRSWLHGPGLPSCADLDYQLRAMAPEVYED